MAKQPPVGQGLLI